MWNADVNKWSICQMEPAIGRMYFIPPTGGEHFYLQTLLTVVKVARKDDPCTVTTSIYIYSHAQKRGEFLERRPQIKQ